MYFQDIIGLHDVKQHLIDTVQRGLVPHARMFYGKEGVGQLPLAIAYARYLNCDHRGATDSCGECPSCHKFNKLAHPDLHFVFPVVKSKVCDEYLTEWRDFLLRHKYFGLNNWLDFIDAQNAQGLIYTDESDKIFRKLNLKIYEAPYKIMIVWLPEKMHESCANKLLKMIEEPPDNTVFLLVTEELEQVLPTIQSRCQPMYIRALSAEEIVGAIQRYYGLDPSTAQTVAHIANGSFRKAIEIIETKDETKENFELFKKMMRATWVRNVKEIKGVATEISAIGREKQKSFLTYSMRLFREYFVSNFGSPAIVYLNEEEQEFGEKFSPYINERNIEGLNSEFSTAYNQIEQNGNAKIIFLDICLKVTVLLKNN